MADAAPDQPQSRTDARIASTDTAFARGKAVYFSEWGCVPEDTTLYQPWDWHPSDVDDPGEQLTGYQGLLEATDGMGDWLRGIDFWHWDMPGGGGSFAPRSFRPSG